MKKNFLKKKRNLESTIKKLENQVRTIASHPNCIFRILNLDQYKLLNGECQKMHRWCDEILVKAYQLKLACGISGCKELMNQNLTSPSLRVLRKKLRNWEFESGQTDDVFKFLDLKISRFKKNIDKDCLLVLDKISITSEICYDHATGSYVGNVN